MRALLGDWARAVGWYVGILAVILVATLTLSSAVGYLPYSDRPGAGWTEPSFSFGQLGYYLSWAVLLAVPAAVYGTALFAFHRLLRHLGAPVPLLRVVGGVAGAVLSFYGVAAAGWYIALDAFPVLVGAAVGAFWGAVLLPRYLGGARVPEPSAARWGTIAAALIVGCGLLYMVFFLPRHGQVLEVNVVRMTPGVDSGTSDWEPRVDERALLDSLAMDGRLELGSQYFSASGDQSDTARALIVLTGRLESDARLALPSGASVVYVQRGTEWDLFPRDAPMSRRRVRLEVGTGPSEVIVVWPGLEPSPMRGLTDQS